MIVSLSGVQSTHLDLAAELSPGFTGSPMDAGLRREVEATIAGRTWIAQSG